MTSIDDNVMTYFVDNVLTYIDDSVMTYNDYNVMTSIGYNTIASIVCNAITYIVCNVIKSMSSSLYNVVTSNKSRCNPWTCAYAIHGHVQRDLLDVTTCAYAIHRLSLSLSFSLERWGAGVETQKYVRGDIGGWGRVPFNETYAPSLSTIYDGA